MPKQKSQSSRTPPKPRLLNWIKNSATITVARFWYAVGFAVAVAGSLDWSPLLSASGMNKHQIIGMGTTIVLIGVSHEIARRRTLDV